MKTELLTLAIGFAMSALVLTSQQQTLAQQRSDASAQEKSAQGNAEKNQTKDRGTDDRQQNDPQDDSRSASDNERAAEWDAQHSDQKSTTTDEQSDTSADNPQTQSAPPTSASTSEGQRDDQSLSQDSERRDLQDRDGRRTDLSDQGRADTRSRDGRQIDAQRGLQFDRSTTRGLIVRNVDQNSTFFRSGFRQGDVVILIDNRPIRSEADFRRFIVARSGRVPVVVLRNGVRETVYVESQGQQSDQAYDSRQPDGGLAVLGVTFDPQARAAVVRSVTPGGPAEQAGLQPDDVILGINREPIRSNRDAIAIVRSMRPGDRVTIAFERELETEAILGGQPGAQSHTAAYPPQVGPEQQSTVPQQNRRIEVDRRGRNDQRGILNRNRNNNTDRPLQPRLLD